MADNDKRERQEEMSGELQTLKKAREIFSSFPYTDPIKKWKAAGKKVIGTGCTYVPEEVIYAAGMLPVRVLGDNKESGLDEADAWLHINTCSYERSRFQMVLDGEYSFLDGFISTCLCDCHRRVTEVQRYLKLFPFIYLFQVPLNDDEDSIPRYVQYLKDMMDALKEHFGVQITEEDLHRGIATVNRKRDLLAQISAIRMADAPPISGTEMTEVMNAGFCLPADDFADLLEELLAELKQTDRRLKTKFRLMLSGSPLNNAGFIAAIEEYGGLIVADETCMGMNFWDRMVETGEGQDPLEAIAYRYHNKIPCPGRTPFAHRLRSGLALAKDYRVDGAIIQVIRNCNPHAYHTPTLARHLEYYGIPVLQLEKEYGSGATGQVRTRVQAFLESITAPVRAS